MKKIICLASVVFVVLFGVLIIKNPQICTFSALNGLLLCARVVIPSLYPFTFCVLFIINSGVLNSLKFFDKLTVKIFGMPFSLFTVFLLSLIGGYPLGAKLISSTNADKATVNTMLMFCVNAGPSFIISAVGVGKFGSAQIGLLLFICHIIPSFVMAFMLKKRLRLAQIAPSKPFGISDNFVRSATAAAETLIGICGFVVLFSIICAYINTIPFLKPLCMLLEITNGINMTQNILYLSFLLGFGGICIWCQILTIAKAKKPKASSFVLSRIFHGLSSCALTYLSLKLFGLAIPTVSNAKSVTYTTFTNGAAVGVSLIIMGLTLIISLKNKNYTGNMLNDIV